MTNESVLVNDEKCEKYIIGAILNNVNVYTEISEVLDEECFYNEKHKLIWIAITHVVNHGQVPDIISVSAELAAMDSSVSAIDVIEASENTQWYNAYSFALRLRDLKIRRRLWLLGQKLLKVGQSEAEDVDDIQQQAVDDINGMNEKPQGMFTLKDAIVSVGQNIRRNRENGTNTTGTKTGFSHLDKKGGFQKSDLIIVAGETSMGKSSYAMSVASNAIQYGAKIAVYSMEMTKEQMAARVLASHCGIAANKILYDGTITDGEIKMVDDVISEIKSENMYFDDNSTSNIDSILFSIRSMKIKYDIDGVIIDYLQILSVNSKTVSSREQAMGDAARRFKNIAKELGIWVMALSQLSRNSSDPIPTLNRLRDSGQIAEAADIVILIFRPERYPGLDFPYPFNGQFQGDELRGKAMLDVAKGRNIGVFKFLAAFDEKTTKFSELSEDSEPAPFAPVNWEQMEEDAPF